LKVRWTLPAANQLESIFEYISTDNRAGAYRTVRRIREAILRVARMPYSGRIGRTTGTREITVSGTSYLVAYRIVEKSIHVLAILHGARQWPDAF
jgi:addiction module RelE/StbE family toxin